MPIKRKRRYPSADDQRRQFISALNVGVLRGEWLILCPVVRTDDGLRFDSHPRSCPAVKPGTFSSTVEDFVEEGADTYISVSTQLERPEPPSRGTTDTTGHLLAFYLDVDFKNATVEPKVALRAVREALHSLSFGAPTMIIASGNGVHVWYLFDEPLDISTDELRARAKEALMVFNTAAAIELKRHGFVPDTLTDLVRLLRVPGSLNLKRPHSPLDVTLVECDPDRRFDFDALRTQAEKVAGQPSPPPSSFAAKRRKRPTKSSVKSIEAVPIDPTGLGGRIAKVLDDEVGTDRSAQVFRAAKTFIEEGLTDGQAKCLLVEHYRPAIDRDDEYDIDRVIQKLRVDHDHAGKTCRQAHCAGFRTDVSAEMAATLGRFLARVEKYTEDQRNRGSQIVVASAMIGFASRAGSLEFDASQREIANEAGINRKTADRALKSLESGGYIERVGKRAAPTMAQRYRIRSFTTGPRNPHNGFLDGCGPELAALMKPSHDAWAHGGLNKSGHRLFCYLVKAPGPVEVDEAAAEIGMPSSTARATIRRLSDVGAVHQTKGGWALTDDAVERLSDAPYLLGTAGRDAARRKKHEWESYDYSKDHGVPRARPSGTPPPYLVRRRGPDVATGEPPTVGDGNGTKKRRRRRT